MPIRIALLISVTTDPADRFSASPHSGGWSESFWFPGNAFVPLKVFQLWGQSRANLLAGECTVTGYRQQLFTISGNKLLPGGSASGVLNYPGSYPTDLNAPQDSLMVNFTVSGQPNNIRHRLAGLPDSQVSQGEYQPTTAYKTSITNYMNGVINNGFQAVTRDLTQPDARVKSIAGDVLTTLTATGAAPGDYVILRRVRDVNGDPVSGSFLVETVTPNADGTFAYALYGLSATVSTPNGTARKDLLVINNILTGQPNRLVVRKIGRPFVQYRGRRSKIRR